MLLYAVQRDTEQASDLFGRAALREVCQDALLLGSQWSEAGSQLRSDLVPSRTAARRGPAFCLPSSRPPHRRWQTLRRAGLTGQVDLGISRYAVKNSHANPSLWIAPAIADRERRVAICGCGTSVWHRRPARLSRWRHARWKRDRPCPCGERSRVALAIYPAQPEEESSRFLLGPRAFR
jgi:hypothetical protein